MYISGWTGCVNMYNKSMIDFFKVQAMYNKYMVSRRAYVMIQTSGITMKP